MELTEEQKTEQKVKVAEWFTNTGIPTSPDVVTDDQLEKYLEANPLKTDDELAAEKKTAEEAETAKKAEEDAAIQKKADEEAAKVDEKPKETVVDPVMVERIRLERENAILKDRQDQQTAGQTEEKEYDVPEGLKPYLDKDLYDPAKKVFGGIELSDDMTITEKDDYDEQRSAYLKALDVIETGKRDHASEIQSRRDAETASQTIRDQFIKDYPDADINAIEETFSKDKVQYAEAGHLLEIRKCEGENFAERTANWLKAQSDESAEEIAAREKEAEVKAAAEKVDTETEISNKDGANPPSTDMEALMEKPYDKMTPEEKKVGAAYVGEEVDKNIIVEIDNLA